MVEQAGTTVIKESQVPTSLGGSPPPSALHEHEAGKDQKATHESSEAVKPEATSSSEAPSEAQEEEEPVTYADAVKHHNREATIPEENEPSSPVKPVTIRDQSAEGNRAEANGGDEEDESATLLDKGKGRSRDTSAPGTPAGGYISTLPNDEEPVERLSTPTRPSATPTKSRPISFPVMPRMASSTSQRSVQSSPSGASTPSRSTSYPNLAQSTSNSSQGHGTPQSQGQVTPNDTKGGKTRKRLNSIKGFVRRISDQGGGLVRSNSTGRPGSRNGGLASPEVNAGDDQKKRLSINRSKSSQGGE